MAIARLTADEAAARMHEIPGWEMARDGAVIRRNFRFADFSAAWAFMSRVALLAEVQDHHPDWSNVYNRVVIELTTHDCKGLSERDYRLAAAIDAL